MQELKLPFEDGLRWIGAHGKDAVMRLLSRSPAGDRYEVTGHKDAATPDPVVLVLLADRS